MRAWPVLLVWVVAGLWGTAGLAAAPRSVVIFVADGLRAGSVNTEDAPTMAALRQQGVSFLNSHALFPTFTTPNAAAIATGHYPGDTGDFANALYTGYQLFNGANFAHSHTESAARLHHIQYIRRS